MKVLVVIDAAQSQIVVSRVISFLKLLGQADVIVASWVASSGTRAYALRRKSILAMLERQGEEALIPVRRDLNAAGIPHDSRVIVSLEQSLEEFSRWEKIDLIVFCLAQGKYNLLSRTRIADCLKIHKTICSTSLPAVVIS